MIRYGKFSNATLLLDFGFTVPNNIYDQVILWFPGKSMCSLILCFVRTVMSSIYILSCIWTPVLAASGYSRFKEEVPIDFRFSYGWMYHHMTHCMQRKLSFWISIGSLEEKRAMVLMMQEALLSSSRCCIFVTWYLTFVHESYFMILWFQKFILGRWAFNDVSRWKAPFILITPVL